MSFMGSIHPESGRSDLDRAAIAQALFGGSTQFADLIFCSAFLGIE
jgi:hypothetical protein